MNYIQMVYSLKTGKTTTMKDCSLIYSTKFSFCHVLPHDDIDDFFECHDDAKNAYNVCKKHLERDRLTENK